MNQQFTEITERIHAFISGSHADFGTLARDLFALQFENVAPYRRFCESRGIHPNNSKTIPALPTSAFRDYEITSLGPDDRATVFQSSATTGQTPSRHFHNLESLRLYEHSLATAFKENIPAPSRTLSLTPSPTNVPRSSLAHMMHVVQDDPLFLGDSTKEGWRVDIPKTLQFLRQQTAPITLMGTAFSFVHLCDAIEPIELPEGSRVMETGGYKNQSRELPKAELHELITATLSVPPEKIHCEYGMCELSSQAYAIGMGRFRFPNWAQARIVSPEHGRKVGMGETGLLEIIDLANVRSVLAIRTADLAVQHEDGFELIGRVGSADPRGCSLNTISLASSPHQDTIDAS